MSDNEQDISGVKIGTCTKCERAVRIGQNRERQNGVWVHIGCPDISLRETPPDDAA